jgi:DNA-binding transcriptional ArsR family regulator
MPNDLRALTEVDRLLHEPSRAVIVAILAAVESADFVFLQRETKLSKGNLSAHLSKLEQAGYIHIEKSFGGRPGLGRGNYPLTLCSLTDQGRMAFDHYRNLLQLFVKQTQREKE